MLNSNINPKLSYYSLGGISGLFVSYIFLLYGQAFYGCALKIAFNHIINKYKSSNKGSKGDELKRFYASSQHL